ncbi:MAG TPA: c-type cytochrome [Steroidobacteraceae bacterium]
MKLQPIALLAALCGLFASSAFADGTAAAGEAKSTPCSACHGFDGNSVNPQWPTLAGQHKQYIVKQLKAFKAGTRQDPLMSPMAATLSEQDMADLAAYFSSKSPTGLEADAAKVSLGQKLYRGGDANTGVAACESCHGPSGTGNPTALFPAIRGQHSTYVETQLKAYRSGTRQTDQNQMMRNVANALSDEQIAAVAAYVQGLR